MIGCGNSIFDCRHLGRVGFALVLTLCFIPLSSIALPRRLILLIDGISYRDMQVLQQGITYKDRHGRELHRQAFHDGYYPVSRMISTFPSISDSAWTEILGDRPLPGYQRSFFSLGANREIFQNGVTTSPEYEKQMTWQVESNWRRTLEYVSPLWSFNHEIKELFDDFLGTTDEHDNYYAFIRSTDSAQHLSADVFAMLCAVDETLQRLRTIYKEREGRDLEILILSDHGNNHAGAGKRVAVRSFLSKAGYRLTDSLRNPKDVVLPTAGVESWVEIHNAPADTEALVEHLWHLPGADLVTAIDPGHSNRFIVVNCRGDRATIDWNVTANSFRYSPVMGDPLNYRPVLAVLTQKKLFDNDGFASADAWMAETIAHHYPLALERIARGHSRVTQNPATILISLNNEYVHCGWLIKRGVALVTSGGTHGGLDELCSDGILLSNFAPTKDTSTARVAALYDGFQGLRDYRAGQTGAEWRFARVPVLAANARPIPRDLDGFHTAASADQLLLHLWTPSFAGLDPKTPVEITLTRLPRFAPARLQRWDSSGQRERPGAHRTLTTPIVIPTDHPYERSYPLMNDLVLEPLQTYRLSWRIPDSEQRAPVFHFDFYTDERALPVAY